MDEQCKGFSIAVTPILCIHLCKGKAPGRTSVTLPGNVFFLAVGVCLCSGLARNGRGLMLPEAALNFQTGS